MRNQEEKKNRFHPIGGHLQSPAFGKEMPSDCFSPGQTQYLLYECISIMGNAEMVKSDDVFSNKITETHLKSYLEWQFQSR